MFPLSLLQPHGICIICIATATHVWCAYYDHLCTRHRQGWVGSFPALSDFTVCPIAELKDTSPWTACTALVMGFVDTLPCFCWVYMPALIWICTAPEWGLERRTLSGTAPDLISYFCRHWGRTFMDSACCRALCTPGSCCSPSVHWASAPFHDWDKIPIGALLALAIAPSYRLLNSLWLWTGRDTGVVGHMAV